MAIELLIKITGDNIEEMLDHLTGIEIKTSNEQLVKWCEEQRGILANVETKGATEKSGGKRGRNISINETAGLDEQDHDFSEDEERNRSEANEALFV